MAKPMAKGMTVAEHPIDWDAAEEAYVSRNPAPTYAELGKEFGCSPQSVSYQARERGWVAIRESRQSLLLSKTKAYEIILKAIENEGPLLSQARQFTSEFFLVAQVFVQELGAQKEGKLSSKIAALNSLGFAAANIGKLMDSAGLYGTAKSFGHEKRDAERNGQAWDKGTMQQINVTVNGMVAALKAEDQAKPVSQAPESKSIATEPGEPTLDE